MNAVQRFMILLLGVSGGWGGTALAKAPADTLRAQGAWGHLLLNARYRYELVDETGKETAHASTLRLRMGYGTPALKGLRMYVEVEGLQAVGTEQYNSLRNGKVRYATVADPEQAELNQLWVDVLLVPKTQLRIGRQRLTYDNHRFIGNVGWRQLEQTYDAVSVTSRLLPAWILEGAYLWRVQNVLSRQQRLAAPLLHLVYTGWRAARVVVYGYWISFEEQASASRSVQTYGIRLQGSRPLNDRLTLRYTGEYAYQMDYRDNPGDFAVQYMHAMVGLSVRQHGWVVTASGALELFTSDRGVAFSTPLATLHAFQGWADRFLRTPPQGLRDLYVSLSLRRGRVQATGIYHDFASEDGQLAYGREFDLVARYVVSPNLSLLVKYAAYQARTWSADVQKYWFMLTFGF